MWGNCPEGNPLMELEKFEYRARLANAQAELEQARLDVSLRSRRKP